MSKVKETYIPFAFYPFLFGLVNIKCTKHSLIIRFVCFLKCHDAVEKIGFALISNFNFYFITVECTRAVISVNWNDKHLHSSIGCQLTSFTRTRTTVSFDGIILFAAMRVLVLKYLFYRRHSIIQFCMPWRCSTIWNLQTCTYFTATPLIYVDFHFLQSRLYLISSSCFNYGTVLPTIPRTR